MALHLCIVLTVLATASAIPLLELNREWNRFLDAYSPQYKDPAEYAYRKQIFEASLERIQKHNLEYDQGLQTYRKGINQFVDKTRKELEQGLLGFKISGIEDLIDKSQKAFTFVDSKKIPESIDWRKIGAVTRVKDQGDCGSCWAFSALGALEGQYFLAKNKSVSFSAQQLVDCSKQNNGCSGGNMGWAYSDLMEMGGVATEKAYPYKGKERKCKFKKRTAVAKVTRLNTVGGDEELLKKAVALHGPIAVPIEVTDEFQEYSGGIFYDDSCSNDPKNLNHGVLVVGYGSENGTDYWIVKNSWGKLWGDEGYIRMSRNRNNNCQIAKYGSFPAVKPINH